MQDLSAMVSGLSISSQQAGNTTADDAALAGTAKGSQSVLPVADRLDVLPQPELPSQQDYAPLIGVDGSPGTRPSGDPFSTRPGTSRLFKQV
jgi:hypothetical protein